MGYFSELDIELKWWEKDDLETLLEDNPEYITMSDEELLKTAQQCIWDAMGCVEEANRLESKADTIKTFIRVRGSGK